MRAAVTRSPGCKRARSCTWLWENDGCPETFTSPTCAGSLAVMWKRMFTCCVAAFAGVHNLVVTGMAGSTFHVDGANEEIQRSGESENDIGARDVDFSLNVGKAAGGEKHANAIPNLIPIKGLARFLRKHLEQVVGVRDTRKFD